MSDKSSAIAMFSVVGVVSIAFLGVIGSWCVTSFADTQRGNAMVGKCLSMPGTKSAKILGIVGILRADPHREHGFKIVQKDLQGAESVVFGENLEELLKFAVVPC